MWRRLAEAPTRNEAAYDAYLSGAMTDRNWDDAEIQSAVADALTRLPALG